MEGEDLTIDELAVQVDQTVRNIRAHQARGLLPPPRIQGRVGYYGPSHVRRLEQIRSMQEEGLNLAAIAKVLNDGQLTAITCEAALITAAMRPMSRSCCVVRPSFLSTA